MARIICICGGGSLGHVCAGMFASLGYKINILTGHPEDWHREIVVTDPFKNKFIGNINRVSSKPSDVVSSSDIILLCLPGYLIKEYLIKIRDHLQPSAIVGSIVSSTGFFFIAHEVLSNNIALFGFQRVPFIARVREYGYSADLLGYKESLNVAFENISNPEKFLDELSTLVRTPIKVLDHFYEASLSNSNPILHTSRLYSLWHDPVSHQPKKDNIFFYADWDDDSSDILIKMDEEFGVLLDKLGIDRKVIPSLLSYYECKNKKELTEKIRTIRAFQSIKAPMKRLKEGWVPDYKSRYFTEDFPFGLKFIRDLAKIHNINTPTIDTVYNWGMSFIENKRQIFVTVQLGSSV